MYLIQKKSRKLDRKLTSEECESVLKVCGDGSYTPQMAGLADRVLRSMRDEKLWLCCNCYSENPPTLTAAKRDNTVYLTNFGTRHADSCRLKGIRKKDDDRTNNGARKVTGARRCNYTNIIPLTENIRTVPNTGTRANHSNDKLQRKRLSSIARLLLSLLEDAGFHHLELPLQTSPQIVKHNITRLQNALNKIEFAKERLLSEIIYLKPWMTEAAREQVMTDIEKKDWPAGRQKTFWMIFTTDTVTEKEAQFIARFNPDQPKTHSYRPTGRFTINGEAGEGHRPPYWVIVRFVRDKDTGQVECREGYAHAMYNHQYPVPVDSNLERATLTNIIEGVDWMKNKSPQTFTVTKPLFDIEVDDGEEEKGYVIPDFLIAVERDGHPSRQIIVETMGYTSDDYIERKHVQHEAMRQLGELVTDPPSWPYESKTTFVKCLYRYLLPPEDRKNG